jgi:hypothetical protein
MDVSEECITSKIIRARNVRAADGKAISQPVGWLVHLGIGAHDQI